MDALVMALRVGWPEVFNSNQGCQFTSEAFTGVMLGAGVRISMDGRWRCLENVFADWALEYRTPKDVFHAGGAA